MSGPSETSRVIDSSFYGAVRGFFVHSLIYPFENLKIRRQASASSEGCARIAINLFKQEGIGAFYKGLAPQLVKTCLKQVWCWPMITNVPIFLKQTPLNDTCRQAVTGISIATIDAAITTPLERLRVVSAYRRNTQFTIKELCTESYKGLGPHYAKLLINWPVFLVAQNFLRKKHSCNQVEPLSLFQLCKIGVETAIIVSIVSAPFDMANTLKHTQNTSIRELFAQRSLRLLYRGSPLSALSLVIHNIASVIVYDKLTSKTKKQPPNKTKATHCC